MDYSSSIVIFSILHLYVYIKLPDHIGESLFMSSSHQSRSLPMVQIIKTSYNIPTLYQQLQKKLFGLFGFTESLRFVHRQLSTAKTVALSPGPTPKNRERGLVSLASFPVSAASARYATITCLTWSRGSQLLLTRVYEQILLRRDYRQILWGKSSGLASVTTLWVWRFMKSMLASFPFKMVLERVYYIHVSGI